MFFSSKSGLPRSAQGHDLFYQGHSHRFYQIILSRLAVTQSSIGHGFSPPRSRLLSAKVAASLCQGRGFSAKVNSPLRQGRDLSLSRSRPLSAKIAASLCQGRPFSAKVTVSLCQGRGHPPPRSQPLSAKVTAGEGCIDRVGSGRPVRPRPTEQEPGSAPGPLYCQPAVA